MKRENTADMNGIPCTLMNEHRDAYAHWWMMIDKGILAREGNYLLHVDHHDDMLPGGYARDLDELPRSAAEAWDFAGQCLGIADFLVPAIWQGIFTTCHIVKNVESADVVSREMIMERTASEWLLSAEYNPLFHLARIEKGDPRIRRYTRKDNGLDPNTDFRDIPNVVLDVDLDYFCWDDSLSSVPEKRMEITREAFETFLEDRDHPFRILPKRYFFVSENDGRYYLIYRESAVQNPLPSEEQIKQRIDRFFLWMKKTRLTPAAIDICRSRTSGYLPAQRAEFVEKAFLARLQETCRTDFIFTFPEPPQARS